MVSTMPMCSADVLRSSHDVKLLMYFLQQTASCSVVLCHPVSLAQCHLPLLLRFACASVYKQTMQSLRIKYLNSSHSSDSTETLHQLCTIVAQ